jgi:DNA-binding SARP family transcriptional activator/tetratricopeptide (TPR) repeat protein
MLELRLLGPLEVRVDGRPVALPGRKARALLAALALHGEPVSVERLIDDLWGEQPPQTARNSLHNAVSALRKTLGPDVIDTRPPGYALDLEPEQFDVSRFQRLTERARAVASPEERVAILREALQLWRGPPLADLAFEPFALLEAPRLEELCLAAQEDLIDTELALGGHRELVPELETLVAAHPFDERLRGQLMLALYRSGRQADALAAYRTTRQFLIEELGLEPGPELHALQQAILSQDAAWAPRAPVRAPLLPVRKTVTILFADLVDSTALAQRLDPEALRNLLEQTFATARAAVERHGGTVEQFMGDAVLAVFGIPAVHEDDALRALRAAVELREALAVHREDLEFRIGVNTGEVFAGGAETSGALVTGAAVNVAKRLEEAAPPGEILLGPTTLRLVREAATVEQREPLRLGDESAIGAWRLVELIGGAPAIPRRFEAPLVGREQELARLRRALDDARDECRCRLVVLVGEPGIGKTRLANEFCSLTDAVTILAGRCVAYGEGATWLPLADALRQALGDDPEQSLALLFADHRDVGRVAPTVAELLGGVGGARRPDSTGETFWAVRRILEAFASERPLLLVLEDVHWAEPTLLDLVEYLEGFGVSAPILILGVARPELLEDRPGWAERTIAIEPLAEQDVRVLIDNLAAPDLDAGVRARIAEVAEGNPLFAEQLVVWAAEGGDLDTVPPSVEALLQSRIDRLPTEERGVLERAAVLGREFKPGGVRALSPPEAAASLAPLLFTLARRGFLEPASVILPREDGFRFHHVLVRDVAYAGIAKSARAQLHERAAEWVEAEGETPDELVGYHLEQAYRYREQLGPIDRHARALAADAGKRLGDAGIRAWKRADVRAAANLLTRATSLLPTEDDFRRELLCELGLALRSGGAIERGKEVLAEATEASAAVQDRRLELRARIELASLRLSSEPDASPEDLVELALHAVPVFEAARDDRSLGRTWLLVSYVEALRCRSEPWKQAAERSIFHYEQSGWSPSTPTNELAAALFHGPTPVQEAIRRSETLLREAGPNRGSEANVRVILAVLKALTGRFDIARELVDQAGHTYEELGQSVLAAINAEWARGEIESLAGDPGAAERSLRSACESLRAMGEDLQLSSRAAELAEILYMQERNAEAAEWARIAERHAAPHDVMAETQWRGIGAKLLARQRETAEAEKLAREAVALISETDALNQHAKTLLDLAEVLRLSQRIGDAVPFIEKALVLYTRKGNRVGAKRARVLVRTLVPA